MRYKTCTKCGTEKPATTEYFYANSNSKGGLRSECKKCKNKMDSARYKRKAEKAKKAGTKKCNYCGESKPANQRYFYAHPKTADGLLGTCKECRSFQDRERRKRMREQKEKQQNKRYNDIENMRDKYKVGQQIKVRRQITPQKKDTMIGWVAGVYDHLILVDDGKYRECFTYVDLDIGEAEIRK